MTPVKTATREQWLNARNELLEREKLATREQDELARLRRELPWTPVEKEHTLITADGPKPLAELFEGRSQLVVYHFMFGPDYDAGCPVCSSIADSFNPVVPHLGARDVTMIAVSLAPIEKLLAYRRRMGWHFQWASSSDSDFNADFGHSHPAEEYAEWARNAPPVVSRFAAGCGTDPEHYVAQRPGLSVFTRSGEDIFLTYTAGSRGLEPVMTYYGLLDMVPGGREGEPGDPAWMRRHDEF